MQHDSTSRPDQRRCRKCIVHCGVRPACVDHADGYRKHGRCGWDTDLDGDAVRKPGSFLVNFSNWQCRRLVVTDAVVIKLTRRVWQPAPDAVVVSVFVRNRDTQPCGDSRRHTLSGDNP